MKKRNVSVAKKDDPIYKEPLQIENATVASKKVPKGKKKRNKEKKRKRKSEETITFSITKEEEAEFQEMLEQQNGATLKIAEESKIVDEKLTSYLEKIMDAENVWPQSIGYYELIGFLSDIKHHNAQIRRENEILLETFGLS
ncbi:hypothetical protein [Hydrogenimonas urashimensis]|uniref:hypothetical protein n=1 Tax=Hydrogenimonas urashimensis TaxID=2740515 RepID=UPI0019156527|nr:hypothetical protein [Hydrogenimonas urashimensis]